MAKNAPKAPTQFTFTPKTGQLGNLFLQFEKERSYQGVTANTCDMYEYAWSFYRPVLEPLELVFRRGKKIITGDERKAEERRLITALKERRNQRIEQCNIEGVTLNTYLRVARTWINWLHAEEQGFLMFDWNKALDELVATENEKPRLILTLEQIKQFKEFKPGPTKFNQHRAWVIALMMLDCGIRIDEALDLKVTELELENSMVNIWDGKGGKYRRIPVDTAAIYLMKYKTKWIDPYRTRKDEPWFFFGTHTGGKMSQRNSLRDLKVVLKKARVITLDPTDRERKRWIPELSWHNFRHTTATMRLNDGESLDRVQRLLGHANPKTTGRYLHMHDDYLQKDHAKHSPLSPGNAAKQNEDKRRYL